MFSRRQLLQFSAAGLVLRPSGLLAANSTGQESVPELIQRAIPSSGELLPVIGMGTSRTFDTKATPEALANLTKIMTAFLAGGGRVIDSSPMYGRAESRVGDVLKAIRPSGDIFAATKVWVKGKDNGIAQMEESARRMSVERFDLIAVHNLKDWKTHLATLKRWKDENKVGYIGITTSHGRDHDELLEIMRKEPLDFVQFSYNIEDRAAEKELLPLARDRGIATMINRPYQRGSLFGESRGHELPSIAADLDCSSWGQFYLKFILGHPAVTCIIPATAKRHHMEDNMLANIGRVPDAKQRSEMIRIFESL